MIGDAKLHRGRDPQGFVDAAEVVVGDIEGDGSRMVFELLAKGIGQTREPALLHPKGEVLAFDVGRADMPRLSYYPLLRYGYYYRRGVAPRGLYGRFCAVVLFDGAEPAVGSKRPLHGVRVRGEGVGRNLRCAQHPVPHIGKEGSRVLAVPLPHSIGKDGLRAPAETIGERLDRDLVALHGLPAAPYDACEKRAGRVSSLSLVRYRGADYSVPTAYGHREVLIRGYVHDVVISCGGDIIARHARSYEREDFVFDPLHYLALLEQKTGALDQAAPLAGWELPEAFTTLRRLLEARMGKPGKREFVQVLRLMEVFTIEDVTAGVCDAIDRGVIGFDAVKHLVLCRIERRPPRLDMTVYPYLPRASVATTSARTYLDLLTGVAS